MSYTMIPAKSVSYGGTRSLSAVKYIVIHYTGNKNDTALANVNYFKNSNTRLAGAHFFADRNGNVYQSIALNRIAWSVGGFFTQKNGAGSYYKTCTNTNSVSIEVCDIADKYPSDKQIAAIKKLIVYIKGQCPNAKTIIRHWDVNGKSCPATMTGTNNATWKKFKAAITGTTATATTTATKTTAFSAYKIRVTADTLNIRANASSASKSNGKVHKGDIYTIVEESGKWGKLKSGAGWIYLHYTQKV